ncbi:reverse transcriptase-like protein [Siminovitchia acidinfaciens]|uniref:Reverse transcriptase-like protein n=1 Tax=Siminovitchia acidinfaciens TaxID=2321395 RepID=A0A429XWS5_9BACI|nr:reverse transcriptase-like protein [Siminovitchia acidinfaciens]RST72944.1 reverse transcriptase-like protein [Siminovitchia acidinfaciens]
MNIKLKFQYKGMKTKALLLESEWFEDREIKPLVTDMVKTGRIKDIYVMDEMGREWTLKEFNKLMEKMEEEPRNPIVYFDGGYDRETENAGIGIVIYYEKGQETYRLRNNAKLLELQSSSEAEYAALYNAVKLLQQLEVHHMPCVFKGDAQGVIKQLEGEWPCYEKALNRWLDRIEDLIKSLGLKPTFKIISRNENKEAHKLASQALQDNMIDSHLKIEK